MQNTLQTAIHHKLVRSLALDLHAESERDMYLQKRFAIPVSDNTIQAHTEEAQEENMATIPSDVSMYFPTYDGAEYGPLTPDSSSPEFRMAKNISEGPKPTIAARRSQGRHQPSPVKISSPKERVKFIIGAEANSYFDSDYDYSATPSGSNAEYNSCKSSIMVDSNAQSTSPTSGLLVPKCSSVYESAPESLSSVLSKHSQADLPAEHLFREINWNPTNTSTDTSSPSISPTHIPSFPTPALGFYSNDSTAALSTLEKRNPLVALPSLAADEKEVHFDEEEAQAYLQNKEQDPYNLVTLWRAQTFDSHPKSFRHSSSIPRNEVDEGNGSGGFGMDVDDRPSDEQVSPPHAPTSTNRSFARARRNAISFGSDGATARENRDNRATDEVQAWLAGVHPPQNKRCSPTAFSPPSSPTPAPVSTHQHPSTRYYARSRPRCSPRSKIPAASPRRSSNEVIEYLDLWLQNWDEAMGVREVERVCVREFADEGEVVELCDGGAGDAAL